jgi:maltose-binding protein MalE
MIAKGVEAAKLDAAARFVEFMTSRDSQLEWIAQGSGLGEIRRLPSHREAAPGELLASDPVLAGVLAQLRVAKGVPPALEMACAWQGMGAYLPAVMAGQMSPDDAAPAMQAEADACLGDMGVPASATPGEPQVSPQR